MAIGLADNIPSDEAILKFLDERRVAYEGGNRLALWDAISWCGWFQAVLPEWVVDAISTITNGIDSGHIRDFNEAFGIKPTDPRTRAKEHCIQQRMMDVTYAVYEANRDGRAVDNELFEEVGKRFKLSLRRAKDCYKQGLKRFPKSNWRKPSPDAIDGYANMKVVIPRRTGRSTL